MVNVGITKSVKSHEANKVAKYWSKYEPVTDIGGFYASSILRPYFISSAYGQEFIDNYKNNSYWAEDLFLKLYLENNKIESILSICCGYGDVERHFIEKLGGVKYCLGVDIAEGAIEIAKRRADDAGLDYLHYECADLNDYHWERDAFDLVISNGALHHLRNLEEVIAGIKRTLTANGIMYACEYVGPSYMDHTRRQHEIINACAFLVPPELRGRRPIPVPPQFRRIFDVVSRLYYAAFQKEQPWWPKWKKVLANVLSKIINRQQNRLAFGVVYISPKERLLRIDPSECVRSADIIPLLQKTFQHMEIRQFGGGILQHALDNKFYDLFDKTNPRHVKTIEILRQLEIHFMQTDELGIENAIVIAHK